MGCSSSTQTESQANKNKPTEKGSAANGTKETGGELSGTESPVCESPEEGDPVESETIADQTDFEPVEEAHPVADDMTEDDIVPAEEPQTAAQESNETASPVDESPTVVETEPPSPHPPEPVAAVESTSSVETDSHAQSPVTEAPAQDSAFRFD